MQSYKIALDIDDVLRQFYPAMCKKFNKQCLQIDIWDGEGEASFVANNFHRIEMNKWFWLNLEKLSRPEDINFMVDCYITSSPRFMLSVTQDWLKSHGFPPAKVLATTDKEVTMRQQGVNVLIDDNIHTLEKVKAAGMVPIQFVPPYMRVIREDLNPITHLSQVPQILSNLK